MIFLQVLSLLSWAILYVAADHGLTSVKNSFPDEITRLLEADIADTGHGDDGESRVASRAGMVYSKIWRAGEIITCPSPPFSFSEGTARHGGDDERAHQGREGRGGRYKEDHLLLRTPPGEGEEQRRSEGYSEVQEVQEEVEETAEECQEEVEEGAEEYQGLNSKEKKMA